MNLLKSTTFALIFSAISFSALADFKLVFKNNLKNTSIASAGYFDETDGSYIPYENITFDNPLHPKKSRVLATDLNVNSIGFGAQGELTLSSAFFLQCIDTEHHQCQSPTWYLGSNPVITPLLSTLPIVIGSEIFETTKVVFILKNVGNQTDSPTLTPPYLRIDYRIIRKSTTTNAVNRTNGTLRYIHVFVT